MSQRDIESAGEKALGQFGVSRRAGSDLTECLTHAADTEASPNPLKVPARHRQYVRTSNLAARAFKEERRRTQVIPPLWDAASLVNRVFAVLIRVSERWGKKQFSEFEQHQIRAFRQS